MKIGKYMKKITIWTKFSENQEAMSFYRILQVERSQFNIHPWGITAVSNGKTLFIPWDNILIIEES